MNKLPKFRKADVVVQDAGSELLIYDLKTNKAYNLNETSKIVYQSCDGITTFEQLKKNHKFSDDLIFLAIDDLKKINLLENSENIPTHFTGLSRREAVKRVGLASMLAIPVITGLVTPTAAQTSSGRCVGQGTTLNGQQIAGFCVSTQSQCDSAAVANAAGCCSGVAVMVTNDPNCGGSDPPHACLCVQPGTPPPPTPPPPPPPEP